MTEQENRLYAVSLLNRAELAFDVRDIAVLGRVIEVMEGDVADLLKRYAQEVDEFHSVGGGFVRTAATAIAEGRHRPPAEGNGQ